MGIEIFNTYRRWRGIYPATEEYNWYMHVDHREYVLSPSKLNEAIELDVLSLLDTTIGFRIVKTAGYNCQGKIYVLRDRAVLYLPENTDVSVWEHEEIISRTNSSYRKEWPTKLNISKTRLSVPTMPTCMAVGIDWTPDADITRRMYLFEWAKKIREK